MNRNKVVDLGRSYDPWQVTTAAKPSSTIFMALI